MGLMRLREPIVGQSKISISTSSTSVFNFIGVNLFDNYPRWSPEVVELERLSDGDVFVGTIGRQVRVDQGRRSESKFRVSSFKPGERLVFDGVSDPFRCIFDIDAAADDSTVRLTFTFEGLKLRPHMRPFEKLIRRVVQDGALRTTQNIKRLLESQELIDVSWAQ